jgi:hypothetical protein
LAQARENFARMHRAGVSLVYSSDARSGCLDSEAAAEIM